MAGDLEPSGRGTVTGEPQKTGYHSKEAIEPWCNLRVMCACVKGGDHLALLN